MSIRYNFSSSYWFSLEIGEKFELIFRVRKYENYSPHTALKQHSAFSIHHSSFCIQH